jgi:hypothetical protein
VKSKRMTKRLNLKMKTWYLECETREMGKMRCRWSIVNHW